MGKSKTVGNKTYIVQNNTRTKQEKEEERKKLIADINEILIPQWLEKSEVYYTLDEKKVECWKELLKFLYQTKCLNIINLKEQIEIWRKQEQI